MHILLVGFSWEIQLAMSHMFPTGIDGTRVEEMEQRLKKDILAEVR